MTKRVKLEMYNLYANGFFAIGIEHLKAAAQLFQINPEELANLLCTQNTIMVFQISVERHF